MLVPAPVKVDHSDIHTRRHRLLDGLVLAWVYRAAGRMEVIHAAARIAGGRAGQGSGVGDEEEAGEQSNNRDPLSKARTAPRYAHDIMYYVRTLDLKLSVFALELSTRSYHHLIHPIAGKFLY